MVPGGGELRVLRWFPSDSPRVAASVVVWSGTVSMSAGSVQLLLLETLRMVATMDAPRVGSKWLKNSLILGLKNEPVLLE